MSAVSGDSARVTVHVAVAPELAFEVFTRHDRRLVGRAGLFASVGVQVAGF